MSMAPIPAPEAKGVDEWKRWVTDSEEVVAWDLKSSPRLYETDLVDPESFHRRLVDWLMNNG